MNFFRIIRAPEWWEYKLPPVLGIGYATAAYTGVSIEKTALYLLFILAALAIGAVYVSLINDITDIDEDLMVGKRNRMANVPSRWRFLFPVCCVLIGLVFAFLMWPDKQTIVLYASAWVAFSLYSIPPFRFKKRGLLGVFCDAGGAHFFPTCLVVSSVYFIADKNMDVLWFSLVGVWSLSFGLRGILWHQFVDRENDIVTGTNTFVAKLRDPKSFRPFARLIFFVECGAFGLLLVLLSSPITPISLILYGILVYIRYQRYQHEPVVITTQPDKPFQIVMLDYYQMFFPIGLLLIAAWHQPNAWVVLAAHLLLFPNKVSIALKDFAKAVLKR